MMIRKLVEEDYDELITYLNKEPHLNLFLIGDLLSDGFDDSIQLFYGYYEGEELMGIMLLYNKESLHLVLDSISDIVIDFIFELYQKYPFSSINMGQSTYVLVEGKLDNIVEEVKQARLSVYTPLSSPLLSSRSRKLDKHELSQLLSLQDSLFENNTPYSFEARLKWLHETYDRKTSFYYGVVVDGVVRAIATATALTPSSAMVIAVGTQEVDRNKGYASELIKVLSDDLYKQGRQGVLFYDNPNAGRIYERIGYEFKSYYYMLMIKRLK